MAWLFFCFAAAVLLIFASISSPTWESISFLNLRNNFDSVNEIHFGIFGYTGTEKSIGYEFPDIDPSSNLQTGIIDDFTQAFILHPIAAGLSGLAFLLGFCDSSRGGSALVALLSALGTLSTLAVFAIDMSIFTIVRNQYREQGLNADWGNAIWITLAAAVASLFGFFHGACGMCSGRRHRRNTVSTRNVTPESSAQAPATKETFPSRVSRWFVYKRRATSAATV